MSRTTAAYFSSCVGDEKKSFVKASRCRHDDPVDLELSRSLPRLFLQIHLLRQNVLKLFFFENDKPVESALLKQLTFTSQKQPLI
jgi:hypothetical protein